MRTRAGYTLIKDKRIYKRTFKIKDRRYAVYGKTFEECDRKEAEKRAELEIDNYNITLGKYFEIIEKERSLTVKKSTLYNDSIKFNRLAGLADRKVRKITAQEIRTLRTELAERLQTSTVNETMTLLKMLFSYAVRDQIISKSPCEHIKALKRTEPAAVKTIHRALTTDEIQAFFKAAETSFYKELLLFLLNTGLRVGEAAALTWNDVKDEYISVTKTLSRTGNSSHEITTPKTKSSERNVPINAAIRDILAAQKQKLKALNIRSLFVFPNTYGKHIVLAAINTAVADTCKKAKIDHIGVHAFRDTFATYAIRSGVSPHTLKDILGHTTINMTMNLYAQVMQDTKQEQMQLISFAV